MTVLIDNTTDTCLLHTTASTHHDNDGPYLEMEKEKDVFHESMEQLAEDVSSQDEDFRHLRMLSLLPPLKPIQAHNRQMTNVSMWRMIVLIYAKKEGDHVPLKRLESQFHGPSHQWLLK